MTPDFDKIQPSMTNGLNKLTKKQQREEKQVLNESETSFGRIEHTDMGTGVAGRSSVKMDNFDMDMDRLMKNPNFAKTFNLYVDSLVNKGYNYVDAVNAVSSELGI